MSLTPQPDLILLLADTTSLDADTRSKTPAQQEANSPLDRVTGNTDTCSSGTWLTCLVDTSELVSNSLVTRRTGLDEPSCGKWKVRIPSSPYPTGLTRK